MKLTVLFLFLFGLAGAQVSQNPSQDDTIRIGVNLVTVNVIVTDW